jgi:hypothetical protein
MIITLLIALATLSSITGAILNGYGSGKDNKKILFLGQVSWVISNTTWVGLYLFAAAAVIALPVVFQLLTFGTFLVCASYSVWHNRNLYKT